MNVSKVHLHSSRLASRIALVHHPYGGSRRDAPFSSPLAAFAHRAERNERTRPREALSYPLPRYISRFSNSARNSRRERERAGRIALFPFFLLSHRPPLVISVHCVALSRASVVEKQTHSADSLPSFRPRDHASNPRSRDPSIPVSSYPLTPDKVYLVRPIRVHAERDRLTIDESAKVKGDARALLEQRRSAGEGRASTFTGRLPVYRLSRE